MLIHILVKTYYLNNNVTEHK